nr:hypothetical protein [Sedimentibacter sp.]
MMLFQLLSKNNLRRLTIAKKTITIDDEKITIAETAAILRISPMGLRAALRNGKFNYFGEA